MSQKLTARVVCACVCVSSLKSPLQLAAQTLCNCYITYLSRSIGLPLQKSADGLQLHYLVVRGHKIELNKIHGDIKTSCL